MRRKGATTVPSAGIMTKVGKLVVKNVNRESQEVANSALTKRAVRAPNARVAVLTMRWENPLANYVQRGDMDYILEALMNRWSALTAPPATSILRQEGRDVVRVCKARGALEVVKQVSFRVAWSVVKVVITKRLAGVSVRNAALGILAPKLEAPMQLHAFCVCQGSMLP